MKKLLDYLPFHFLLCLIFGICIQFYTDFWILGKTRVIIFLIVVLVVSNILKKEKLFITLTWLTFFYLGSLVVYESDNRNSNLYFAKHITENSPSILVIDKVLKSSAFHHKYEAEVAQVNNQKTIGKVLLNINKDSVSEILKVGNQIYAYSDYKKIQPPLNPYQFDYRSYLARKGIHRQLFLKKDEYLRLESKKTFLGWIANIRLNIQVSLKKQGFSKDEFAVINALLLGQRQEISKELLNDYSRAGAIHILAVSGLHVGIILLILSSLLKSFERLKHGKTTKLIFIICFLWFFALIAGMSASVVRAVTMFSAVAVGQAVRTRNSIEQSLVFSMLILLLCKPMFLFDVGFQFSYLAVFGIVWIQPKLSNLWKPKFKLTRKTWQLITVSTAAQLSVFPLSLFYFHQFPGLFLLSNLVIIPFLGTILIGGILIIILSLLAILPQFLENLYGSIISLMNDFVQFISRQEAFLFSDISFSFLMMLASYLLIITGSFFLNQKTTKQLLLFLCSIVVIQTIILFEKYQTETKTEFLVFHKNRNSIYGMRNGNQLQVNHSSNILSATEERVLRSYKIGENIEVKLLDKQSNYLQTSNKEVLIIDSLRVYEIRGLQTPIILLKESPKINLERLIRLKKPSQIVADGSNYKSYIEFWKQTCTKTKTPFWYTGQNGVYRVK